MYCDSDLYLSKWFDGVIFLFWWASVPFKTRGLTLTMYPEIDLLHEFSLFFIHDFIVIY